MKKNYVRKIVVYKDYFINFRKTLDLAALKKVYQVLTLIMTEEIVPEKFLKSIEGRKGLYEIRVEWGKSIYRVFCCFDEGHIIVLFNGFQKKTQKTPSSQLDTAEGLMRNYFEQKHSKDNG